VPCAEIAEQAGCSSRLRQILSEQVAQIIFTYKLSVETTNLQATHVVPEIRVFSLVLKGSKVTKEVLRCIDKASTFPIIFELSYNKRLKVIAGLKSISTRKTSKCTISKYIQTSWIPEDTPRLPLPSVMTLGELYEHVLRSLMAFPSRNGEGLYSHIDRVERIEAKQRRLKTCTDRLRKEKQFNRKVALNSEIRALENELEILTRP
jgi:hypothetical protein